MHTDPPLRRSVLILLSINLCLTLIRQLIDLLGRLWLPIVINFVNILVLIFAIFGTCQLRTGFLSCFGTWTLCWLAWNAFLICFYLNIGNLDRNEEYMSFGMKGSHSWWVENTPMCQTMYNHTLGHWVEAPDCLVQYYYIEVVQAGVHLLLTSISIILVIAYLQVIRSKTCSSSPSRQTSSNLKQPRVTVEFSGATRETPQLPHPDLYDGTSSNTGYMNTSFESSSAPVVQEHEFMPSLDPNGQLVQNYRKSGKRKSKRKHEQHRLKSASNPDFGAGSEDDYPSGFSRAPTQMLEEQARFEQEDRLRQRQRSHSVDARNRQRERRKNRHRSASPPQGRPTSSTTIESRLTPEQHQNMIEAPRRGEKRTSSVKYKPFKHYATPGLHNMPIGAPTMNYANGTIGRSQSQDHNLHHIHNIHDHQSDLRDYTREPRRLSKVEPKCLMNSVDSMLNSSRLHSKPANSIVSFDPKSDNTLLRYHEHMQRSHESQSGDSSSGSIPSSSVPPLLPPYKPLSALLNPQTSHNEPTYVQATRGRPPAPPARTSPSVIQQRAQLMNVNHNLNNNQQHQYPPQIHQNQQNILNYYSVPPVNHHNQMELASNDSGLPPSLPSLQQGPGSQGGSEWSSGSDDREKSNYNQPNQIHNIQPLKIGLASTAQNFAQMPAPQFCEAVPASPIAINVDQHYQPRYSKGPQVTRPSHFINYQPNPPINSMANQFHPPSNPPRAISRSPVNFAPPSVVDTSYDSLPPPPPLPESTYAGTYAESSVATNSQPPTFSRGAYPSLRSQLKLGNSINNNGNNINGVLDTGNCVDDDNNYRQEIVNNFLRDALNQQQQQSKSIAQINPLQKSTASPMINDRSLLV